MPRIWLDYCQFLMDQAKITRTRRVFDRAIRALPITQHNRIWQLYIKFVTSYPEISDTAMKVYRRISTSYIRNVLKNILIIYMK